MRRTHKLLSDALETLLPRKPYDEITIKDITDVADVGYVTFFRHFKDKDALLLYMMDELLAGVLDDLRVVAAASPSPDECRLAQGRILFDHVRAHETLYRALLNPGSSLKTYQALVDEIAGIMMREMPARHATGRRSSCRPPCSPTMRRRPCSR